MKNQDLLTTRRDFLKTTAAAGAILGAPAILSSKVLAAQNGDTLRVGLVGCGGRGTGAAGQALSADPNVVLTAVGDAFEEKIAPCLNELRKNQNFSSRIKVTPETSFAGLDAYLKVINSGVDVVLLATPPGFRPVHLRAAVEAGKHVFCEKPMGTDAPGVRSVIESGKLARKKNLALMAGFCWRYDTPRREFYKRIHEGAIGEVRAVYATYFTSPVKSMPPADQRPKDMGDLEWQMRNWYNFVWLSGDGLVEQACHSVDKIAWGLKDATPIKAVAVGGRNHSNNQGNIFDHIFISYEFENDVRAFMGQRQIANCANDNSDYVIGEEGFGKNANWGDPVIRGKSTWRFRGEKTNMYQQEHNELFASIRKGEPINDSQWMAHSTMMALMGRMAAYTGQEVTWEEAFNSKEQLVPDNLDWKMNLDIQPMAVPGHTKLI